MIEATVLHAAALAAIHAASFPPGEVWNEKAMAELLAMSGVFGFIDPAGGLILARCAGGEAEILTLAVAPNARRHGVGRALLEKALQKTGHCPVFLEVAATNTAANALYAGQGFALSGRRQNYYGSGADALVLCRNANGAV